jgi:hypothetical protein
MPSCTVAHVGERLFHDPVAGGLAGDLERLDDVHARRDQGRERAGEPRHRHLEDNGADLHRNLQLEAVPDLLSLLGPLRRHRKASSEGGGDALAGGKALLDQRL